MTTITIKRDLHGNVLEFEANGHTDYGVQGEDIVCAAASSIIQTAALGILMVAQVGAEMKRDDKRAYFQLKLPDNITSFQAHDCKIILNTMLAGLNDLSEQYSDFIELKFENIKS
jgi:hypothetical protein